MQNLKSMFFLIEFMKSKEQFEIWNQEKQLIHRKKINNKTRRSFREREIWFCSIGQNIGTEEFGKNIKFERPVLIIKKYNQNSFLGIPLTSKTKKNSIFYSHFNFFDKRKNKEVLAVALLSQIRFWDAKRLNRKMLKLSEGKFKKISIDFLKLLANNIKN